MTQETPVQIPDVEKVNIDDLRSDGQNPNRMTAQQTGSLILNIKRYGFIVPIVTNKDLLIADGEQRWNAAKTLGMKTVSIIRLPVEDVDRRLLRQTLNKIRGEHVLNQDVAEYQLIMDAGRRDDLKSLLGLEDKQLRALMRRDILFSENNQNFVPDAPATTEIKMGDISALEGSHQVEWPKTSQVQSRNFLKEHGRGLKEMSLLKIWTRAKLQAAKDTVSLEK